MAVTHGTAGGDETLVATPSGVTVSTKGISAGANISLSSDSSSVTVTGANAPSDQPIAILRKDSTTTVTNGATVDIEWTDSLLLDPSSMWDSMTNPEIITIPEDGVYQISATIRWGGAASADGWVAGTIWNITESSTIGFAYTTQTDLNVVTTNPLIVRQFSENDQLKIRLTNQSGQTLSALPLGTNLPVVEVYKIRST